MKTGSPEWVTEHGSVLRKQSKLRTPAGSIHGPLHYFRVEATTASTVISANSATKLNRD